MNSVQAGVSSWKVGAGVRADRFFAGLLLDDYTGSGADKFVELFGIPVCEPETSMRFGAPYSFRNRGSVNSVSGN